MTFRPDRTRRLARLAATTGLALLLTATGYAEAQGVLTIGRREDSTTFDPITTAQNVDYWVYGNIFETLIATDRTGTELAPGLAERWEMSDDGLTYTFHLRASQFSDCTPVTASDAAFTLLRVRDDPGSLWADYYSNIADAQATDDRTLVVTLHEPWVPFLAMLAVPALAVLPQATFTADPEGFAERPVGSGAFRVAEWRRGDRLILARNACYWNADAVSLDGVEWISIPDDNSRVLSLQTGQIHAAIFVPFSRVAELQQDPNLNVMLHTSTREDALLINHTVEPLNDVRVRMALDYAIDRQAIVDVVTFGHGSPANSFLPQGFIGWNPDNPSRERDVARARELLAEAGVENLTLELNVKARDEVDEQTAVLIQQQFAEAGITVTIRRVDPATQWDMFVEGDFQISVGYFTKDVPDPDQKTTFVLGHDANLNYLTRYESAAMLALVNAARNEPDPERRIQLYHEIQALAKEDVHWIDLYYSPYVNVTRANVTGFFQNPLGRFFLEDVVIE